MNWLFWVLACPRPSAPAADLPAGYAFELWRPTWLDMVPRGLPLYPFGVWWAVHQTRVFSNREYAVLLIRSGSRVVHRTCVFPGYWPRFPFMAREDLQFGDIWTEPDYRGRGLAAWALGYLVNTFAGSPRRLWYLVEETNRASLRVVRRAGFVCVGRGRRVSRWGLRLLGSFVLDQPTEGAAVIAERGSHA